MTASLIWHGTMPVKEVIKSLRDRGTSKRLRQECQGLFSKAK